MESPTPDEEMTRRPETFEDHAYRLTTICVHHLPVLLKIPSVTFSLLFDQCVSTSFFFMDSCLICGFFFKHPEVLKKS